MPKASAKPETPTAIHSDLTAIFVSLELSQKVWLVTSLSPGSGEKMSKHSVPAGDVSALLLRFAELTDKAKARTGKTFQIVCVQEAGLDGFWLHRLLVSEASKATWSIRPRSRPRAVAVAPRRTGLMARRSCVR